MTDVTICIKHHINRNTVKPNRSIFFLNIVTKCINQMLALMTFRWNASYKLNLCCKMKPKIEFTKWELVILWDQASNSWLDLLFKKKKKMCWWIYGIQNEILSAVMLLSQASLKSTWQNCDIACVTLYIIRKWCETRRIL